MLPNPLLRHIYNNASDDVIRRGKKIFHTSGVSLIEHDLLVEKAVFRVRNDIYDTTYRVTINNFINTDQLNTRCHCPYNMGVVCKHEAAALLQLNELLQSGYFEQINLTYDQKHTLLRMRTISDHHLQLFGSDDIRKHSKKIRKDSKSIQILKAADDTVEAQVVDQGKTFSVKLVQNEERYFDTSCECDETKHPLCAHKLAVFEQLLEEHGPNYFSTLRNWDKEKNKLLALYGYSLDDDLKGKFEFAFVEGKLTLRVLNPSIKKLSDPLHPNNKTKQTKENEIEENEDLILVFTQNNDSYPYIESNYAVAKVKDGKPYGELSFPQLPSVQNHISFSDEQKNIAVAASKINKAMLIKALKRDLPFADFINNLEEDLKKTKDLSLITQVWEYTWPKLNKLLEFFKDYEKVYLTSGKEIRTNKLYPIRMSDQKFKLRLYVSPQGSNYAIQSQIILNDSILNPKDFSCISDALILHDDILYGSENVHIPELLYQYPIEKPVVISAVEWEKYLEEVLLKLDHKVIIAFHEDLHTEVDNVEPELALEIREFEQRYILIPIFYYNGIPKKWQDASPAIASKNGKVISYVRNQASENTFLNLIKYLHPNMQERRKLQGFVLPVKDALRKGWYFDFIDLMKTKNVKVQGLEQLKQARINPNKPVANIQFTTGIDWFSAKTEVFFGDQRVSLAELKKAITKSQDTIKLPDGSQGLITEEFINQYGLMFKMGKLEGDEIKISKIHFSAIDHLEEVKENSLVFDEIEEKKRRLVQYDFDNTQITIPENLQAELRPYQQSGYYWMGFLKETGWGGILADDMGLGKTVQTLSTLLRTFNENPKARFLVVCPTSLIYNWENECKKFTPDMTYHIYHGSGRKRNKDAFNNSNLIITTYGTLRGDIDILSRIEWDYVVLDESQAIKNPLSQASKAAQKLQAKNKLALSGTPIQNNTFDLFSQMNFLNPGMLGSIDFFKNEFAIPIDKMQDEVAKEHLKKLIFPFLLRRTKEQVAPDLPEKTETVLYCEMGSEQRKVYEAYRQRFRSQILGSIEEVGLERSHMSILTGLMKLRQICDSPAILNEPDPFENYSVKLEELKREITENLHSRKSLVFSQFLGMLDLIRKMLDKENIPYVYFDGSTSGAERERAIKRFQEDEDCKVFLISLKAGGVGLNLTAADYVYIVDPWWNPSVEQQAIDRTHRIGQTKKIFAYRMICKDTIEEKILMLQERKLGLAKELISEDAAFLKKLTREDVEFLLS